jgi:hypothetical protein
MNTNFGKPLEPKLNAEGYSKPLEVASHFEQGIRWMDGAITENEAFIQKMKNQIKHIEENIDKHTEIARNSESESTQKELSELMITFYEDTKNFFLEQIQIVEKLIKDFKEKIEQFKSQIVALKLEDIELQRVLLENSTEHET